VKITIITDDLQSWFIPFGHELQKQISARGYEVNYVHSKKEITKGDVCFILSCTRILGEEILQLNKNNIVVHASDLPLGRGWSPLQWQILEGKNEIILTMFEAVAGMDEGPYYLKSVLSLDGSELLTELRKKMATEIINMCIQFIENRSNIIPMEQKGLPTYYRKRNDADDEIDINKTIQELFNHLRIADNNRHPIYFHYREKKFFLQIYQENECADPNKNGK
jgi:methionyl-tRNA formyltransferase